MGIKKFLLLSLIVLLAICSYIFLINKYNPEGVELNFRGDLDNNEFKSIKGSIHLGEYSINYSMPYKNDMLIMTTGMDRQFNDINIVYGQFFAGLDNKVAVIGDKIADKYFKTDNVLGKEVNILEDKYQIVGVIKNSNKLYIPYDKKLTQLDWKRKSIRYEIKYEELFYTTIEKVEGQLRNLGIDVYDTVVYKEEINGYINLIVILAIYILIVYIIRLFRILRKECFEIWESYSHQRRTVEWYMFLKNNIRSIANTLAKAIAIALMIFGILKIKSFIHISETYIPDNLFSPSSYIEVIEVKYNQLLLRLQNGFSDILINTVIINIIFLVVVTIAMWKINISNSQRN